jgi:hypothetical protein
MSDRSVIVVVLDRWGAGQAAPLGATSLEMPFTNRLAASALTGSFCISDSGDLERVYRSYWTGFHAADPRELGASEHWLSQVDVASLLVTDEPLVRDHDLARHFEEKLILPSSAGETSADEVAETHLARLLFAAGEAILNLSSPHVVWIHARAMEGPWDAPLVLRQSLADEDDPKTPEFVTPPSRRIEGAKNYDELLGIAQAYGGQVLALDEVLGALVDVLDQRPAEVVENTLLVVTSPRGFPLGEHSVIGAGANLLYSELLHVPLFARLGRGRYGEAGALQRTCAFIQPVDVAAAISHWLGAPGLEGAWGRSVIPLATYPDPAALPPPLWRTALAVGSNDATRAESYFTTPGWALRTSPSRDGDEPLLELFAKPDDRWEVNEIGSRAVGARELMVEQQRQLADRIAAGDRDGSPPLPDLLLRPTR